MDAAVLGTFGPVGVEGAFAMGLKRSSSCFCASVAGRLRSTHVVCRPIFGPEAQAYTKAVDEFGPSLQSGVLAPLPLAFLRCSGTLLISLQHCFLILRGHDNASQDRDRSLFLELETSLRSANPCALTSTYHSLSKRYTELLRHLGYAFICSLDAVDEAQTYREDVRLLQEAWLACTDRCYRKHSAAQCPSCQQCFTQETHVLDGRRNIKLSLILGVETLLEGLKPFLNGSLHRSSFLQRYSALLHPLQGFGVLLHHPTDSDPVLSRPTRQNMFAAVYWFSSEPATFSLRLQNFLAFQMSLKHESVVNWHPCSDYLHWVILEAAEMHWHPFRTLAQLKLGIF